MMFWLLPDLHWFLFEALPIRLSVDSCETLSCFLELIIEIQHQILLDFLQFVIHCCFETANLNHEVVPTLGYATFLAVLIYVPGSLISQFIMGHALHDVDETVGFIQPSLLLVQHLFELDVVEYLLFLLFHHLVELGYGLLL